MLIDVPVYNDDGSVKFTASLNDKELQAILQFGLNMAVGTGLLQSLGIRSMSDEGIEHTLND